MRKSRFSEEQIVAALQLVKSGGDVSEICRKLRREAALLADRFVVPGCLVR